MAKIAKPLQVGERVRYTTAFGRASWATIGSFYATRTGERVRIVLADGRIVNVRSSQLRRRG